MNYHLISWFEQSLAWVRAGWAAQYVTCFLASDELLLQVLKIWRRNSWTDRNYEFSEKNNQLEALHSVLVTNQLAALNSVPATN